MNNSALGSNDLVNSRNAELSIRAYMLAQKSCVVAGSVLVLKNSTSEEDFADLSNEVSILQNRLALLGGYFSGLITVDDGVMSVSKEEEYMSSAEYFLKTIEGLIGATI